MSKFLYPIYKLKTKSYIKWWLYHKKAGGSGILSEILLGFSFNLENTLNRKFKLFEIEGNSVQDGSPSPDNEVPIYSSGDNGSINEKIQNKNWFDVSKISQLIKNGTTTSNGITNIDNVITINKTNGQHGSYAMNYLMPIKSGQITVSFKALLSGTNSKTGILVALYNSTATMYATTAQTKYASSKDKWLDYSATFELNQEAIDGIHLDIQAANTGNVIQIKDVQVELGTTATSYVPHEEQDYSIFVQQPMRSIGDVRDCFVNKDGSWYERHYIKYLDLAISAMNNSENYPGWTNVQQIKNDFPNINTQLITKTSFLCNIFEKTSRIMVINTVGNNSIMYIDKSLLNLTQTQWKENYPNLVLKLGYISPEPLDLPCTPEQVEQLENLPSTYKDFTIIQSEDETPAHLKIQYYKEG